MSERTTIDVIMVEPMKPPRMVTLNDSLESMQEDLKHKYMQEFKHPQDFIMTSEGIKAIPIVPHKEDLER